MKAQNEIPPIQEAVNAAHKIAYHQAKEWGKIFKKHLHSSRASNPSSRSAVKPSHARST
ncbi:MAG: hypothetical protein NTX50_10360 [Candidatus Sumerlaeota bacterium]|nr:hypothetical protein [Candidatus Sumerlaeota bacterium]